MKSAFRSLLGLAMAASLAGAALAQSVPPPPPPPSAAVPALPAASKAVQMRSPAVRAADKAQEPGILVPEQRVIPQISVPLRRNNGPSAATPPASLPAGTVRGAVNDGAARCLASGNATDRAACERGQAASGPMTMGR